MSTQEQIYSKCGCGAGVHCVCKTFCAQVIASAENGVLMLLSSLIAFNLKNAFVYFVLFFETGFLCVALAVLELTL